MSNLKTILIIFLAYVIIPVIDLFCSTNFSSELCPILITSIAALGLTVVTGLAGLLHLGMAAFVAIGVYAYAILTCNIYPFQLSFWTALLLASLIGLISGVALGLPTIRLRGDYLAIVTLGFAEIIQDLLKNLEPITKGTQGINPLPAANIFSLTLSHQTPFSWYFLILGILALVCYATYNLEHSSIGRAWRAINTDELAAACSSVNIMRSRLLAFSIAALFAALSGALLASYIGSTGEPSNFDFQRSVMILTMIIVGGLKKIEGALLGTFLMVGMNSILLNRFSLFLSSNGYISSSSILTSPNNWKYLIYGLILILVVRTRPKGIVGA